MTRSFEGKMLTFNEWLGCNVFSQKFIDFAYGHWDQGHPLDWALHVFSR